MKDYLAKRWVIIAVALGYALVAIGWQWEVFSFTRSRADYEYRYSKSQYVMGDGREIILGDGDIYTYAGIRYVEGEDVTKINFEHTPLVKYLFGLSFKLTGMPNWAIVPFIFVAILSFWELARYLIEPVWGRWLALGFLLLHSTIYDSLSQTMLDFPAAALVLAALAFHLKVLQTRKPSLSVWFGLMAGLALAAKYPFPLTALLLLGLVAYQVFQKIPVKQLVVSIIFMLLVYLGFYLSFLAAGNSLIDWLKFEWWRWQWFGGKLDSPRGMIWQTIFLGRYPKWWEYSGEYVIVGHWSVFWPVLLVLYAASWLGAHVPKPDYLFPYKVWIIVALGAFTLGVAEDRFLVPLIPGFCLYGSSFLVWAIHSRKRKFLRKVES